MHYSYKLPSESPSGPQVLGSADMDLQKILIDERMRCEHHKTNYQTLKAEHTRLQDEYTRSQNELKRHVMEKQSTQENMQLLLAQLRGELLDKTREVEELRMQVLSPQRLELLRAQVQQELEGPVRERFNKLEGEAEKYRSDFNKLRYDYTFLKSEYDHHREEHSRMLEEWKLRYDAEISCLERDKEELTAQLQNTDPARDGKRVETLLREKAQLHLRLKGLEREVAQVRTERDSSGAQAENVQRIQVRQLAETQATVKALEAEKQSVKMQLERTESELQLSHEQITQLTTRLHKAEREVNSLTSQVEDMKHTHKLEVTNVKLECVRARGGLERERDALQSQVEGLQSDVEVLRFAVERNKDLVSEKERDTVRRVQAAREEELHKMAAAQEEKLELESRLAELEQQWALQETSRDAQRDEWQEQIRGAQLGEESARRETQTLRQAPPTHSINDLQLHLHFQRNQEINVQLHTLSQAESELVETNQKLRDSLERIREELRNARTQIEKTQHEAERLVEERRVEWLEDKHKFQERNAELQEKYTQAKERMQRAALAQKKRKTMTEAKEKKFQDRIQLLEAKIEELELEAKTAKKRPSYSEEHAQTYRRLKELQRRHSEFRRLLLGYQFTSTPPPPSVLIPGSETLIPNLQDEQHQQEMCVLRRRLEELECNQQQQLEEVNIDYVPKDLEF
uniref:Centrosomal protein of 83 kDa n=1 Tax=Denticeps clupeoides TaxID=299321 RepID=A0AAY4EQ25_9TELE